jgi:hypothetical protein
MSFRQDLGENSIVPLLPQSSDSVIMSTPASTRLSTWAHIQSA